MGAAQSSGLSKGKESFYDILNVGKQATSNDLKLAYRKLALQLHPDRNFSNEDEATSRFAKVQAAYDTLSDPQERQWYDNHQEDGSYTEYNANITSSGELKSYLQATFIKTLDTKSPEFFQQVTALFVRLTNEEREAAFERGIEDFDVAVIQTPTFGGRDADYSTRVKPFYDVWTSFSTLKSFAWEDVYPTHQAQDRRMRRAMETRNKRIRDAAKKEFNNILRQLVRKLKELDPRVLEERRAQDLKLEQAKQKKEAQKAKAAQKSKQAEYKEQGWDSVEYIEDEPVHGIADDEQFLYECIVCDKTFKSRKQLLNHELSAVHVKALKKLRWQMRNEGLEFELDEDQNAKGDAQTDAQADAQADTPGTLADTPDTPNTPDTPEDLPDLQSLSVDDILAQMDQHQRPKKPSAPAKLGKAKQKRLMKQSATHLNSIRCITCQTDFPTRNKLFEHVKTSGHASFK